MSYAYAAPRSTMRPIGAGVPAMRSSPIASSTASVRSSPSGAASPFGFSATSSAASPSQSPPLDVNNGDAALPPMLRALVSRSRASSRPTSASPLASTQEVKLAAHSQRDQQMRSMQMQQQQQHHRDAGASSDSERYYAEEKEQDDDDQADEDASTAAAAMAAAQSAPAPLSPSAALFQRDLGPLYNQFQSAAQRAQATLASGFPGSIRTAFERTSYWQRAPPTRSTQLGTLAWLFLHYAFGMSKPAEDVSALSAAIGSSISELESAALRLSFRSLLFLCTDWKVVPQLTSKAHLALLYHRFGGVTETNKGARVDVGLTYAAFIRCLACIALAVRVPAAGGVPAATHSSLLHGRPPSAASASSAASTSSGAPRDKALAFLTHLRWNDQEVVSSGLERLRGCSWYRLRNELPEAKSVYVHKPTCLQRETHKTHIPGVSKPAVHTTLRTQPCAHASAPRWAPLAEQIVAGITDRPSVLHIDPHRHAAHSLAASANKGAKAASAQRPNTSPGVRSLSSSASASATAAASASSDLSKDEERACTALRTFDRLPLESSWCAYPGPYIDMGVVEVLPALEPGTSAARAPAAPRDPSDIAPAVLRPHRYTLKLQNRTAAGLKVSIASDGCEWLSLAYKAHNFLSLGMSQKLHIRAPTHMPPGLVLSGGNAAAANSRPASSSPFSKGSDNFSPSGGGSGSNSNGRALGQGVERLGHVLITVENSWTYAVSHIAVPVYARLVLQGTSDRLQSLPKFQPVPSVPALLLPTHGSDQQQQDAGAEQQQRQQSQPLAFEVRDELDDYDDDE